MSLESHPERRNTIAEGELVKLNLVGCGCGRIYVSPQQASKIAGATAGWFDGLAETRSMFESCADVDPVIRISPGNRGKKACPNCTQTTDKQSSGLAE